MHTRPARTVSVSVGRSPDAVYRYLADPHHLPEWAPGFATSVHKETSVQQKPARASSGHRDGAAHKERWIVETADGAFAIAFAPHNRFGVVDHRVTSDDGLDAINPMRVIANSDGAEVLFTLFQPAGATDDEFQRDLAVVESDLQTLKRVLEGRG